MNNKIKGIMRRYASYTNETKITFKNGSFIQTIPSGITYRGARLFFIDDKPLLSNARYAYEQ